MRRRYEERGRGGESARIQYEATPQRTKHPSVLIFSVSYAEDLCRCYRRHPQPRRHAVNDAMSDTRSLMTKFSIRQTSVRGNGASFTRATLESFNREKKTRESIKYKLKDALERERGKK